MLPRYKIDRAFYDKVRDARLQYRPVDRFTIPVNNGQGFHVKRGQTFRVVIVDGPQISDVTFWNAQNPGEFLDIGRTLGLEGWFVKPYSRLWSQVPWFRPMATCLEDTVIQKDTELGYHHHFLGSHCAPEIYELRSGRVGLNACHLMLLQSIEPFGLKEVNILHNLNIHQKARIDPDTGKTYCAVSDSRPGDYIEFYAEIDLLVAATVCPNGDGILDGTNPSEVALHPVLIEVCDTGIQPREFPGWTNWRQTWNGRWTPPPS